MSQLQDGGTIERHTIFEKELGARHVPAATVSPIEVPPAGKAFPTQLLNGIATGLQLEQAGFSFNHFGLHISCWKLLRAVQKAVDEDLRRHFGNGYLERESQLIRMVPKILRLNGMQVRSSTSYRGNSILKTAAEVMQKMLKDGDGEVEVRKLESWIGRQLVVEEDESLQAARGN
jgi:hypothetical protein